MEGWLLENVTGWGSCPNSQGPCCLSLYTPGRRRRRRVCSDWPGPRVESAREKQNQEREVALLLCQGGIGNCSTHLRPRDSVSPWLSFLEDTSLESFGCWWCRATSDRRKLKFRGYKLGEGRKLKGKAGSFHWAEPNVNPG